MLLANFLACKSSLPTEWFGLSELAANRCPLHACLFPYESHPNNFLLDFALDGREAFSFVGALFLL